jgi:hypothetical protein
MWLSSSGPLCTNSASIGLLLVAGKDWWWEVRDLLGLRGLRPGSLPVIASGQIRG